MCFRFFFLASELLPTTNQPFQDELKWSEQSFCKKSEDSLKNPKILASSVFLRRGEADNE